MSEGNEEVWCIWGWGLAWPLINYLLHTCMCSNYGLKVEEERGGGEGVFVFDTVSLF